jgi:hypothetical protein
MSATTKHAAMTIGVVAVVGFLLTFAFREPDAGKAILVSAVVAVVVQLAAFAVSRAAGKVNVSARMGAGAMIRLFSLMGYALVVIYVAKLPASPALVSLALFFFLSTLGETLLIRS